MDFWLAYRAATDVRLYPTIWRIRLLLTSRVWDPLRDARIWEDASRRIIGFAMLWRRQTTSPYIVLDCFADPSSATEGLLYKMLLWGNHRAEEIANEQKVPLTVYANGFSRHGFYERFLRPLGYTPIPPNPSEHNIYFVRQLQNEIPVPDLPPGYTMRQLRQLDDLESVQSISGFAKVNPLHQRELIDSSEYCHLVVVNPAGEFAAYCECSICLAEWQITDQRIGWIDYVETRPGQQKQGLGRAILLAGLSKLWGLGANTAMLVTINTNIPAVNLYEQTGFERLEILEPLGYQKQIVFNENQHASH